MAEQRWRSEVEMARSQLQLNHFDDAYETASNALQATIPARAEAFSSSSEPPSVLTPARVRRVRAGLPGRP
jgi:hypothetical protein